MSSCHEGLLFQDRSIIDVASGGVLINKTPREAWELNESMGENSQQFSTRKDVPTRKVNEVEISSVQQQLSELTSLVKQLTIGQSSQARAYGICTHGGHPIDMCPTLQEKSTEKVHLPGHALAPRRQYDPYSNTYNSG
mgnify:CR=1 FL=1